MTSKVQEQSQRDVPTPTKSRARHIPTMARILMGLLFTVTGLNGFLNFIPPPKEPMPEVVMAFVGALIQSRYMFPMIMGTQLLCGLLLLSNRFVPLALTLLAPVVVNILAFHLVLAPAGTGMAVFVTLLEMYLAWSYRSSFRPMLAFRATTA